MADNPTFIAGLDSRQCVSGLFLKLTLSDFLARNNVIDLEGPPGSQIVAGDLVIRNNSDATGTDTIKIGDDAVDNRYLTATSIKQADGTRAALTPTGYRTPGRSLLRITRTPQDTTATNFEVTITATYLEEGKIDYTEG